MDLSFFLQRVIDEGIAAATKDYSRPNQKAQRDGSVAGFEACRNKNVEELRELLLATHTATEDARHRRAKDYWWYRCYESEVEWVCNCLSAVLRNEGLPIIVIPTARGFIKAADIIGVKKE